MIAERARTYKPVAKRATVYTDVTLTAATHGTALRMPTGQVFFLADTTGLWTDITDMNPAIVHLYGQEDLILSAAIADGDLVVKCSKTLQQVRA